MIGFIYIMSNPSHPGLLKIGQTGKDPEVRRKELGSTGVVEDFVLEYRALSEDYASLEREIHRALASVRTNPKKEFFSISVPEAVNKIREISGNRIESDKVFYVSPEEFQKIKDEKQRKSQEEAKEWQKRTDESKKRKVAEEKKAQATKLKERERKFAAKAELRKKLAEKEQEEKRQYNRLDRQLIRAILFLLKVIFYPYFLLWKMVGSDSAWLGFIAFMGCFPVSFLYVFVYSSIFS